MIWTVGDSTRAEFAAAVRHLVAASAAQRTTIMCAEAVPWRCHSSLVGDALLVRAVEVIDILSENSPKAHKLTPWASVEGLRVTYPKSGDCAKI